MQHLSMRLAMRQHGVQGGGPRRQAPCRTCARLVWPDLFPAKEHAEAVAHRPHAVAPRVEGVRPSNKVRKRLVQL